MFGARQTPLAQWARFPLGEKSINKLNYKPNTNGRIGVSSDLTHRGQKIGESPFFKIDKQIMKMKKPAVSAGKTAAPLKKPVSPLKQQKPKARLTGKDMSEFNHKKLSPAKNKALKELQLGPMPKKRAQDSDMITSPAKMCSPMKKRSPLKQEMDPREKKKAEIAAKKAQYQAKMDSIHSSGKQKVADYKVKEDAGYERRSKGTGLSVAQLKQNDSIEKAKMARKKDSDGGYDRSSKQSKSGGYCGAAAAKQKEWNGK